jgi:hypothetical protein
MANLEDRVWYKIRDLFFGDNFVRQDIPLALQLASSCRHPDATWLVEVCRGKCVSNAQEALDALQGANDARALCFAWVLRDEEEDLTLLRQSAEKGYAFAQAWMAEVVSSGLERFRFANLAALQGERYGSFCLGGCFHFGDGCEKNLLEEKKNFLIGRCLCDGTLW